MKHTKKFSIGQITKQLNELNPEITFSLHRTFPKMETLSHYHFKKKFVKITPKGAIEGGMCRMITSLIDFSFIRSLVAHRYSAKGPACYDPPSIFLLDLFRFIDKFNFMETFCETLQDNDRGRAYRTYAGINSAHIPCQATFSNFRERVGESLYNEIFHVLVDIFHQLGMITFNILSHDGTLYPTWARYKGCTWFSPECTRIPVQALRDKVRRRILYRLNNMDKDPLGSEIRVYTECPGKRFPEDVKKPKIELLACKLAFSDGKTTLEQQNTAAIFGVKNELEELQLTIHTLRCNLDHLDLNAGNITCRCPKLPADTDARVGVRKNPQNPSKKQKIFGYNLVLTTSVEIHLKLELPVAVTNIAGNAEEGSQIITNHKQILDQHECQPKVDIADAKYDITENYQFIRENGSIPIIDYNRRRENLSAGKLVERGYDQNGWPFAPCGLLCRPNGYEKKYHRLSFCCFKKCTKLNENALKSFLQKQDDINCPHMHRKNGFATHRYIDDYPRLLNEIPRGTKRYEEIKKSRSASERANSSIKVAYDILNKPRVLNAQRAGILAHITAIVLLLTRAFTFIIKHTMLARKPAEERQRDGPKVTIPKSIRNLIQLE